MSKRVDLLNGNITSSLARLALPIMGMSLLQMTYSLIDTLWIGKLGAGAVASVGSGGQLLWFCAGIHMLAQIGGQVFVGQKLGANEKEEAGRYAHASIMMSAMITIGLGLIFFFQNELIISFFNLNTQSIIDDAQSYIKITGGLVFFSLTGKMFTSLITTTGDSKTPLYASTVGLVLNIILDPIMIFGYFGFPALGVTGAAIATVIAQAIVFALLMVHVFKDQHLFSYVHWLSIPDFTICKKIFKLSMPVAMQNTLFPMISMYISRMIAGFGDNAIAVQRVGSQVEAVSWMAAEGYAVAVNSFIAQNFGAKNLKRAKEGFYQSMKIVSVYGLFASCLLIFGSNIIFSAFLSEPEVVAMGVDYLVILGYSQIFLCIEIVSSSAMNAFGKTKLPALISFTLTAARIPVANLLILTVLGLNGIWWTISISSILKGVLMFAAIAYYLKHLKIESPLLKEGS
ncbi:MAG: MATE family efflux transporter [Erysipelotrichaceae bacterium]